MNIVYNILITVLAVILLITFGIGAWKDSKKSMDELRRARDKKHAAH